MNEKTSKAYAYYALTLLTSVYVLNFLDRVIILYLFPLIKKEFSFSDLQLSLFGTTAFALFYTTLGIPFGRLADKRSRVKLIAIGLAVWSLFTALTGFAWDFWSLFFCRLMVGVGEATLGPAAISLLADYFPPSKRATVTSIYSAGIAIGAGLAAFFGGTIGELYGWRMAFYIFGFPGILIAIPVFLLKEPERKADTSSFASESLRLEKLLLNKTFILLCLGYAFLGLATNNLSIWGSSFYSRLHGFDLATIGFWGGVLTIISGIPATLFGGVIADKFQQHRKNGRTIYSMLISSLSIPLWLIWIMTDNVFLILLVNGLLLFLALAWLGAAAADVTEIAGKDLRGLAVAIYFFSVNIAAYLIGSNLIGFLNDQLGATSNPSMMRYALLVCPISCLLSAFCLWLASNRRQV
jgi:MFS family permease